MQTLSAGHRRSAVGARLAALATLVALTTTCAAVRASAHEERGEEEAERRGKVRFDPALVTALLPALQVGPSVATSPPGSPSHPLLDNERIWSRFTDWEPAVACSRDGRFVYQMTTRYGDPAAHSQPVIVLRTSTDFGATWFPDQYVDNRATWEADPQVQVADDGTVFICWLSLFKPGILFQKSTNHGFTWTPAIVVAPASPTFLGWSDKPILFISGDGQDVYIAFSETDCYVVVSHDGGQTFSAPIKTNNDSRLWLPSGGCVARNGDAYFTSADYSQNYSGVTRINVIRSTNGGATWKSVRVDLSQEPPDCSSVPGCYPGFLSSQSSIAVDRKHKLMLVYNAGTVRHQPHPLWATTSKNGVTWSAPVQISVNDPLVSNAFPAVVAGPDANDFRVVWQDDRRGGAWNTWYQQTTDAGLTWQPSVRLSNIATPPLYKSSLGYDFVFGDYLGLAVDGQGAFHAIWGEGVSYNGPGSTWYTRGK